MFLYHYGAVQAYSTLTHPFTRFIASFDTFLQWLSVARSARQAPRIYSSAGSPLRTQSTPAPYYRMRCQFSTSVSAYATDTGHPSLAAPPLAGAPDSLALRDMFFPPFICTLPPNPNHSYRNPVSLTRRQLTMLCYTIHPPHLQTPPNPIEYDTAIARVDLLDAFLTPGMRSTLTCPRSVIEMHLSPNVNDVAACTHSLITRVASSEQTPDRAVNAIVDTI